MNIVAWLLSLLVIGATFRLTRLITADYIAKPLRRAAVRLDKRLGWTGDDEDDPGHFEYLTTCDWCVSFWVGIPVATVADLWGTNRVVIIGLLALTASGIAGLLSLLER